MLNPFLKKTLPILFLAALLGLTGCSSGSSASTGLIVESSAEALETLSADDEDANETYDASTATLITLKEQNITITGKGASSKGSVITISKKGTYVISGSLKSGQLIIDADKEDKVHLVFNGVSITSSSGPALWIKSTEKTMITLVKNTQNTLSDSQNYALAEGEDEPDAALFSKEDLSINGSGTLTVNGKYANGIKSKDTLLIMNGTLKITSKTHAIAGKDGIGVFNGTLNLTSGEDGIHSSSQVLIKKGTIKIAAADDGIHADDALTIDGGTIQITKSYEGLESANITVNNGTITLNASDDGFNAAGGKDGSGLGGESVAQNFNTNADYFIKINGGNISVNANGDGLDANGAIYITGGTVLVSGPTNDGNGAMDYDATCKVTGGILAIAGSSGMAQAPDTTSTQNSILVYYTNTQAAGTVASLTDSTGKTIASFAPAKAYKSIVFSSPSLTKGKTYNLLSGQKTLTKITIASVTTLISDKGVAVTGGMGAMGGGGKPGRTGTPPSGTPPTGTPPTGGKTPPSGAQTPPTGTKPVAPANNATDANAGATAK